MKKLLLLFTLILAIGMTATAGKVTVRGYKPIKTGSTPSGPSRDYLPMNVPISVDYDEATGVIEITAPSSLTGVVYVYNDLGIVVNYSPMIPAILMVTPRENYKLYMEGEMEGQEWIAEAQL